MTRKTIQLPVTLPQAADRRGACTLCLEERLLGRPGIHHVRVTVDPGAEMEVLAATGDSVVQDEPTVARDGTPPAAEQGTAESEPRTPGTLELDYDPEMVGLTQINGYLRQAGGCLHSAMAHVILPVNGIVSPRQESTIQTLIERLPAVRCTASYASQTLRLEFDRRRCALPEIVRVLEELGITLRQPEEGAATSAQVDAAALARRRSPLGRFVQQVRGLAAHHEIVMAFLAGLFLVLGAVVHWMDGPNQVRVALLLVSYVCGGFFPAQEMIKTLARLRLDIDLLMFAAAFGAAALGHFEEGAMLLFLFSLGGAGEELAMSRARHAIEALSRMAPKTALRLTPEGRHVEIPVEDLRLGDLVFVSPGQQVPADGVVVRGASAVNQAPITGESVPVEKAPGDTVYAGTLNGQGALTLEVHKLAADNTLAKIIRMVQEAQATKSPTQLFTDKVEAIYVPIVILATGAVMVAPPLLATVFPSLADILAPSRDPGLWKGWFYQAMAFLTAASPCALAIGTPAAVLSGIGRAARGGVLIKGGVHLENLGRVQAIAFDKTGTLTLGQPQVSDVIPLAPALEAEELLRLAAAVEQGSQHPLAQAIVNEALARDLRPPAAEQIAQTPGIGIQGVVHGRTITLGRPGAGVDAGAATPADMVAALQKAAELEAQGRTTVLVRDGARVLGLIALADRARPGAAQMVQQLRALGVQHVIMLTGDNSRTAAAVAQQVGIDEYHGDLMPQDKLARISDLDQRYGRVAMVGDGVNDAPALATATIGIAIGGATGGGSDVALETADVALLSADMGKLPEAVGISRFSRSIIKQNLTIALGVIAVVSPLAALGLTNIALAVLLHEGSTVLVVLNSLRILRYRPQAA